MARIEPAAAYRVAAKNLWECYTALRQEGFDENQSMILLLEILRHGDICEE